MAVGCFIVHKNEEIPFDIKCSVKPDYIDNIPKNQRNLYLEVEKANNTIRSMEYTSKETREEYSDKLLSLTQAGLVGDSAIPELALLSLKGLKQEILIREGGIIKNKYMLKLGWQALLLIILTALIGCLAKFKVSTEISNSIAPYFFVWCGAMVGTWISFGVRKLDLSFEDLAILEKDRMSSFLRLFFVGFASIILLLFINSSLISFKIGNISIEDIKQKTELQLLLGSIAGLLEQKLAVGLFSKARDLLNIQSE